MFITKDTKAIGLIVDQRSHMNVGVLLTKELNLAPIRVLYFTSAYLAKNTINFDKCNTDYAYNLFAEHMLELGATPEALDKFMLYAPVDVQNRLNQSKETILKKWELFCEKTSKKQNKTHMASATNNDAVEVIKKEASAVNEVSKQQGLNIDIIRQLEDAELVKGNMSTTLRNIIIKYYDTKTNNEIWEIAKKLWVFSDIPKTHVSWYKNDLRKKGIINY